MPQAGLSETGRFEKKKKCCIYIPNVGNQEDTENKLDGIEPHISIHFQQRNRGAVYQQHHRYHYSL